ncbi:MAG: hypothetical protein IRZ13_16925 [Acetobacteraceae bacterium]|nr:hypothetical protein [Acetobacteraceae bacterium]
MVWYIAYGIAPHDARAAWCLASDARSHARPSAQRGMKDDDGTIRHAAHAITRRNTPVRWMRV